jgi:hypothetical protein
MKKQGYAETTFQTYAKILEMLVRLGANLNDPESVKETIAKHDCGKGRKWNIVKAYTLFLKMQGLTWEKPKYYPVQKLPFIPTEKEIDDLIAGSSRQMALFLQVLKETGAKVKHSTSNGQTSTSQPFFFLFCAVNFPTFCSGD